MPFFDWGAAMYTDLGRLLPTLKGIPMSLCYMHLIIGECNGSQQGREPGTLCARSFQTVAVVPSVNTSKGNIIRHVIQATL